MARAETAFRRAVIVALAIPLSRYLAPVTPPASIAAFIVLGWFIPIRRPVWRIAIPPAAALAVAVVLRLLLPIVGAGGGGWIEEQLVLLPWHVGAAAAIATGVVAWDWWAAARRGGAVLFVPSVALAVVALFWSQAEFRTDLLSHPSWYAVYALTVALLVVGHQVLRRRRRSGRRRELIPLIVLVLLIPGSLALVYRGWQQQAVAAGGGLLQPTAFRFDFAEYLRLEPEISLSRDLVFLYRETNAPPDRLLRRYVLSGYTPRRGFFRLDEEPAPVPPGSLEAAARRLGTPNADPSAERADRAVDQEYYVVNFDPDAFVAVNEPVGVARLRSWSRSSFNSAYRVRSRLPAATESALRAAPWPSLPDPGWRSVYVDAAVPTGIADLAAAVTSGATGYYETVDRVLTFLREEYYYSLTPGDAVDGDQLQHFLFESRKGYCTYFAFSMALMLRSLEIPARVAVGFFVDPRAGTLGFYPIRGDMAHAWVEVWFDGIGWVEFDPTATTIAPGESVNTDYRIDQERLSALIEEILAQGDLAAREESTPTAGDGGPAPTRRTAVAVAAAAGVLLAGVLGYRRRRRRWSRLVATNPRRAALRLGAAARSLTRRVPEADLSRAVSVLEDRARFAPSCAPREVTAVETQLRTAARVALRRRPGTVRSARRRSPGEAVLRLVTVARALWLLAVPPAVRRRDLREDRRRWAPLEPSGTGTIAPAAILFTAALVLLTLGVGPARADQPDDDQPDTGRIPTAPVAPAERETRQPAEAILDQARAAMDAENYEAALSLLQAGQEAHPDDHRFAMARGDLFYDQELFVLARDAYRAAIRLGAPDYGAPYLLSRTLARLNEDAEAIEVLESLARRYPEDITIIDDLSWLYFKTHRLEEARDLLEGALEEFGPDRDLAMTLATVYSGLWDYERARREYEDAIAQARRVDDRIFQSVAYYNLSILHANFYRFDEALAAAETALEMAERPGGYMIRAELRELQRAVEEAAADYHRALVIDDLTPLADLSLAVLWLRVGYPDRALTRLDRITEEDNRNWMYNFGTDPARYELQVVSAYADAWSALADQRRLQRPGGILERIQAVVESLAADIRAWYFRGRERRQRRRVADSYAREGRDLLASWNRMIAAERIRPVARHYARRARAIETPFNPRAAIDYDLFLADQGRDADRLWTLGRELEGPWYREDRATTLRDVYRYDRVRPGRRDRAFAAAAEAWAIAPGSFLVDGLRVPVALSVAETPDAPDAPSLRRQRRVLRRMGFALRDSSPLVLELTWSSGELAYRVWDRRVETDLRRGTIRWGVGATVGGADDGAAGGAADGAIAALEEAAVALTRADEAVLGGALPVENVSAVGEAAAEPDGNQ